MSGEDAADEAIETALRFAMTTAAQVGQMISRAKQQRAQQEARESAAKAREYDARYAGEREIAAKWLDRTNHDDWWAKAEPRDAVHAYEMAVAWAEQGEQFGEDAARRIEYQTQQRWETPIDDVQREQYEASWARARDLEQARLWAMENRPDLLADYDRLSLADELLTEAQRQEAAAARERIDADVLAAWADRDLSGENENEGPDPEQTGERDDHSMGTGGDETGTDNDHREAANDLENEAEAGWDNADRREAYAGQLHNASDVDANTAKANIANDKNNAKPATAATAEKSRRNVKPKRRWRRQGREHTKQVSR